MRKTKEQLIKELKTANKKIIELSGFKKEDEASKKSPPDQAVETKYHSLVNNLNVGVYRNTGGPHGKFIEANPAIAKMFGYESVQDFIKIPVSQLYKDPDERKSFIDELKRKGAFKNKELYLKRKNGEIFIASVSTIAHYNSKGEIDWTDGVIEDVTERKQTEAKLEKVHAELERRVKQRTAELSKSEARLRAEEQLLLEAQKLGKIGNWEYDLVNDKIIWSDELYELFERDKSLGPPTAEKEASYYIPADAAKLQDYTRLAVEKGQKFKYDLTANLPSGKKTYFSATMSPIKDERGRVIRLFGTIQDITERKLAEDKISHLVFFDGLTDIPNRTFFDKLLTKKLSETKRENKKLAVFFLDLDNFKKIKNILGYDFANKLIIKITGGLKLVIPDNGQVGKVGEDEYLLFAPIASRQDAREFAQNILNIFKQPWTIAGRQISVTANIGIALFPDDGRDIYDLETHADAAMSSAKKEGFNNYIFFEKGMAVSSTIARRPLPLASSINAAINNRELLVYYQPIVNIKIGEIIGMEALVRWQKPGGKLIMPGEFIPLAEDIGQIVLIGDFVFESACRQLEKWQNLGYANLKLTINLSAKQFLQKNLVEELSKRQKKLRSNITIELTESDIMRNPDVAIKTMNQLKEFAYTISIDDFGSGYASLNYLKKLPVDFIKIDKSFIDNIIISRKDQAIVSAIINMAHGLGLIVTAEGVETRQQYAFLRQLECDEVQGYFFAKPMPADEFEKLLGEQKRWAA